MIRWIAALAAAALLSHWLGSGAAHIVEPHEPLDLHGTTSFGPP